jgi:hypothetical protein
VNDERRLVRPAGQKRRAAVVVIDSISEKPSQN